MMSTACSCRRETTQMHILDAGQVSSPIASLQVCRCMFMCSEADTVLVDNKGQLPATPSRTLRRGREATHLEGMRLAAVQAPHFLCATRSHGVPLGLQHHCRFGFGMPHLFGPHLEDRCCLVGCPGAYQRLDHHLDTPFLPAVAAQNHCCLGPPRC